MPKPDVDNHTTPPTNCQFRVWVLWMPDAEEIVLQVKMGVNPHIGLTQSHKDRDVLDPQEG
jgi:hypothetical protein